MRAWIRTRRGRASRVHWGGLVRRRYRSHPWAALRLVVMAVAAWFAASAFAMQPDPTALRLFTELVKRHRELSSVTVKCDIESLTPKTGQPMERISRTAEMIFSKGGLGRITSDDYTVFVGDGRVRLIHRSNDTRFFEVEAKEYINSFIVYDCFGQFSRIPLPHLAVFWGGDDIEELLMEFYADTPDLLPRSVSDRTVDGQPVRTIEFRGEASSMSVNIDPRTMFIRSITHRSPAPFDIEGVQTHSYLFTYTVHDPPLDPKSFAFVQGERTKIDDVTQLVPKPEPAEGDEQAMEAPVLRPAGQWVGKPAPAFTLAGSDGRNVTLGDLRGRVVVIDFWAVWCPPCRAALPELHRVAAWAKEKGLAVEVYAINTFEAGSSPADKRRGAMKYWREQGLTLPVLFDLDNAVAGLYGVTGIPATFVIGPDGVVAAQHTGFPSDYADALKQAIEKAAKGAKE